MPSKATKAAQNPVGRSPHFLQVHSTTSINTFDVLIEVLFLFRKLYGATSAATKYAMLRHVCE